MMTTGIIIEVAYHPIQIEVEYPKLQSCVLQLPTKLLPKPFAKEYKDGLCDQGTAACYRQQPSYAAKRPCLAVPSHRLAAHSFQTHSIAVKETLFLEVLHYFYGY